MERKRTLYPLSEAVANAEGLDKPADKLGGVLSNVFKPGAVKDALSGTWLGHPLHPMLTDVVIGSWTSAFVLDLLGGRRARPAADALVATGCLAALPTAAAGASDWVDTWGPARRVGLVHASSNTVALFMYWRSLKARRRDHRARGIVWSLLGAAVASFGAYLGGHLTYGKGIGVNQRAFESDPESWTTVLAADALAEDKPAVVHANGAEVMLVRHGARVYAMGARCTHRGGPLQEGDIDGTTVTCPWHGSCFDMEDGYIVRGPATSPETVYDVRESNGRIELRARSER